MAAMVLNDPVVKPLAQAAGVNFSEVTSYTGEPPDATGSEWHAGWGSFFSNRVYCSGYPGQEGANVTTQIKYLIHCATDTGVPAVHGPAGSINSDHSFEYAAETEATFYSAYPPLSGTSYSGTLAQVRTAHYNAVMANATAFKDDFWGFGTYAWAGVTQGQKFAKAVVVDYFLAQYNPVVEAGSVYRSTPGQSISFSSAGSYVPSSITWNSNGTYYNNGGGMTEFKWDLNNDGTYETTGASPTLTHAQLVTLVGYTEGRTISLRVKDDLGKYGYDTSTVAVYSNPTASTGGTYFIPFHGQVTLTASGSDADGGSITEWKWDIFNDGTYNDASGRQITLTWDQLFELGFTPGGSHQIGLWVKDNDGTYAGTTTASGIIVMEIPEPALLSMLVLCSVAVIKQRRMAGR